MFNGKDFNNRNKNRYIFIPEKFAKYLYDLISSKIEILEKETPINPESKKHDIEFLQELLIATQSEPEKKLDIPNVPIIDYIDLVSNGELVKQFRVMNK